MFGTEKGPGSEFSQQSEKYFPENTHTTLPCTRDTRKVIGNLETVYKKNNRDKGKTSHRCPMTITYFDRMDRTGFVNREKDAMRRDRPIIPNQSVRVMF